MGKEKEPLAQLMADIFLYSVDKKNLRNKGETYIVTPDSARANQQLSEMASRVSRTTVLKAATT